MNKGVELRVHLRIKVMTGSFGFRQVNHPDGALQQRNAEPTEATVVACAARLKGAAPVSIGLPLPGWDLAVIDKSGVPVSLGEVGELVIGGVGLARYLDP